MRQYDLTFSCGYSCGVTEALREAQLQFASLPFDWMATPGFRQCAEVIAGGFEHWMEREDLELVDVRRGGINKHVYRNRRTRFGFVHDFSSFATFETNYPEVVEKYARRIARLQRELEAAKRVLAVYAECPKRPRIANSELVEVQRILAARYPGTDFELVYFYVAPDVRDRLVESVATGISAVGLDYRIFEENGELSHQMNHSGLVQYLRSVTMIRDPRTEAEKAAYAAAWKRQDRARWHGRNWLETMVNRTAFRLYRKLERFLIRKSLVPPERPLWFD